MSQTSFGQTAGSSDRSVTCGRSCLDEQNADHGPGAERGLVGKIRPRSGEAAGIDRTDGKCSSRIGTKGATQAQDSIEACAPPPRAHELFANYERQATHLLLTPQIIVNTINRMHITFDANKDVSNVAKHGVSLALAKSFEWGDAIVWPDERKPYGERRQSGIGYIGLRLYAVAFVDRAEGRRIISLRKANKREEKVYAQT